MDRAPTLYERLGGASGLSGLLVAFYGRVLADPVLEPHFIDVPMDKLLRMQEEFFAMALEGPQHYSGRQLAEVHHGRGITMAHFHRFQQHLLETLQEAGVPADDIRDVIRRVAAHRHDVIG